MKPHKKSPVKMIQTGLMMFIVMILIFFSLTGKGRSADLGLIDVAVLNSDSPRWVVLDARPKAEWETGHIPGSRSFSWENYKRTDEKGVEFRIFPSGELAVALADLGIDEKTPVVIYGDADKSWGGEGWNAWVLSWLGHKGPIRVLDGGIKAWTGRNLALTKASKDNIVKKARYQVNLKPQLDISTEELDLKKGSLAVVDVRSTFERLKARIPGSIHIPWEKFYKGSNRHPISSAELKNLLADHDIDTSRPVVYYCLGGIRSSYAWLVHQLAGLPTARNYEGGMAAWQKRPSQ